MYSAIAFVATIIGIILGIVELQRYQRESEEDRELIQTLFQFVIVIGLVGYGAYFFYFGPKSAGDKFIDSFRRLDSQKLYDLSCEGTELRSAFGGLGGAVLSFGGMLGDGVTDDESFVPLANKYNFEWTMVSFVEEEWHAATLYIKSDGPFSFCVKDADGL